MPPSSDKSGKLKESRQRRGDPAETRERLITAAGALFNRVGYHGTDSNRIAKEAGYATGTFYKHFKDKRDLFLTVYEEWITSEWRAIDATLSAGHESEEAARRIVELLIGFHTKWRGLRASLMELVFTDTKVRQFYRNQRRIQLDVIAELRGRLALPAGSRESDAIHLYTSERTYDAIGQGELEALGLDRKVMIEILISNLVALIS
jgi:AcrR family transcriptional regulator